MIKDPEPFKWEVQVGKAGRKAMQVSVVAFTDPQRPHLQSNGEEYGCVTYSLARKKGFWRVKQLWPVGRSFTRPVTEEAEKIVESHSEQALARLTGLLHGYIAALRLGYRRTTL